MEIAPIILKIANMDAVMDLVILVEEVRMHAMELIAHHSALMVFTIMEDHAQIVVIAHIVLMFVQAGATGRLRNVNKSLFFKKM